MKWQHELWLHKRRGKKGITLRPEAEPEELKIIPMSDSGHKQMVPCIDTLPPRTLARFILLPNVELRAQNDWVLCATEVGRCCPLGLEGPVFEENEWRLAD